MKKLLAISGILLLCNCTWIKDIIDDLPDPPPPTTTMPSPTPEPTPEVTPEPTPTPTPEPPQPTPTPTPEPTPLPTPTPEPPSACGESMRDDYIFTCKWEDCDIKTDDHPPGHLEPAGFGLTLEDALRTVIALHDFDGASNNGHFVPVSEMQEFSEEVALEVERRMICAKAGADPRNDTMGEDEVALWRGDTRAHFDIGIGPRDGQYYVSPMTRAFVVLGMLKEGSTVPPPTPDEVCWAPTEKSWSIAKGNPTDCAACSYQEMQRTGWPLGPYANSNCQRWNQWMPCRCSDGGQWPGVQYTWTKIGEGYFEWRWSKGDGACDAAPGKCFCGPDQPSRFWRGEIRRSDTCLWIPDRGENWDRNICRFEQVPC